MNQIVEPATGAFNKDHLRHWDTPKTLKTIHLSDKCVFELTKYASQTTDQNFTELTPGTIKHVDEVVEKIRNEMASSGAVIVDRIPIKLPEIDVYRRAAGILSNMVAPLMEQDVKGTLLYDVVDDGSATTSTTRRSKTNVQQPFHTDGPWHKDTPSIIGLFCIKPAEQGGYSQVSSLQHAINEVAGSASTHLDTLQKNLCWNNMGQFVDGEKPYSELPVIEQTRKGPLIRHYVDYVKTGHDLSTRKLPDVTAKLLERIESQLKLNAVSPFKLQAGQMQFVNNRTVAHARAGFDDHDPNSGRHLVRLWNKASD